jgi:hypothetical protein
MGDGVLSRCWRGHTRTGFDQRVPPHELHSRRIRAVTPLPPSFCPKMRADPLLSGCRRPAVRRHHLSSRNFVILLTNGGARGVSLALLRVGKAAWSGDEPGQKEMRNSPGSQKGGGQRVAGCHGQRGYNGARDDAVTLTVLPLRLCRAARDESSAARTRRVDVSRSG